MFSRHNIECDPNIFDTLFQSVDFEVITDGRWGANIVDTKDGLVPIVRTTSNYNNPNQNFRSVHYDLVDKIKNTVNIPGIQFNNAMVELYDFRYIRMGFHTDQSLDLDNNSYICIFSCYDNPSSLRTLQIQDKVTRKLSEISLDDGSLVIFSVETNKTHVHKIIGENNSTNQWLGITFRLSKTFIMFNNEIPYFYPNSQQLRIANDDEKRELMRYKGIENREISYTYPQIDFTISCGDMIQLK